MSNLIGLYPALSGTLDGAPNIFSANTVDTKATVEATGYFTDKVDVMNDNDILNIITDTTTTPDLLSGSIVETGTAEAPVLTFVEFV